MKDASSGAFFFSSLPFSFIAPLKESKEGSNYRRTPQQDQKKKKKTRSQSRRLPLAARPVGCVAFRVRADERMPSGMCVCVCDATMGIYEYGAILLLPLQVVRVTAMTVCPLVHAITE